MTGAVAAPRSGFSRSGLPRYLLAIWGVLAGAADLQGQRLIPSSDARYKVAEEVYDNLAQAAGISIAPVLVMKAGCCQGAYFTSNPAAAKGVEGRTPSIVLEEDAYDVCTGFGSDLRNCLAVILGHELAHYGKDHDFVANFARAYPRLQIGKAMAESDVPGTPEEKRIADERHRYIETEADYYGGMYGYMAGYQTFDLAPRVVAAIYEKFHLTEHPPAGYPALEDRKQMARESQRRLALMAKTFSAANWLLLLGRFDEAAACYDYLLQDFQSRELFNNAAAARVLQALREVNQIKFALPLEIDARSRLTAAGRRGPTEGLQKRDRLLKEAMGLLLQAQGRDAGYATALVNIASVYLLQADWLYAAATADRALSVAAHGRDSVTAANALLVRGIAHYFAAEPAKALADFEEARSGNPLMAAVNIAVMGATGDLAAPLLPRSSERLSVKREAIAEVSGDSLSTAFHSGQAPLLELPAAGERSAVTLVTQETAQWTAYKVVGESEIYLLITGANFSGRTIRGIGVGSSVAEVKEKYGEPASVAAGRQGAYMVYQGTPIIFHLNEEQRVVEWSLYSSP